MARNLSIEEIRAEFLADFPTDTGQLAFILWNNIASLHLNWKNYRILFGTSLERVELLNHTAAAFFALLERVLRHEVVMSITRLTDPPASDRAGERTNASLQRLIKDLKPYVDSEFHDELDQAAKELRNHCKPIRDLRDKLLAHSDLATALEYHSKPLPGLSRAYMEDTLERIRNLMGKIEERFRGSATQHQHVISARDAESLVDALEQARKYEQVKRREFHTKYGLPPDEKE
ncbi:hypothetical protein KAX17_15290 [Candidatus Bipolaricaulota bacterium]|nr:hypothetical protein [Candidatus Bipolaricaulota bacterium]